MRKRLKGLKSTFPIRTAIIIIVVMMVVGYASVSTVLELGGSIAIGFKFDDVNIYIANLYSNNVNKYNSISDDKMEFNIELQNGINNIDVYVSNNATQYDEYISFECNNEDLNGVSITANEDNPNTVYSQMVLKNSFVIENTGETQTLNCKLKNLEVESTSKSIQKKKIIFASDGFENATAFKYIDSMTYGELPILEKQDYTFVGWFDINDNKIESTTQISTFTDEVLFARFESVRSIFFAYNNSKTNIECDNVQCALVKLNDMVDKKR